MPKSWESLLKLAKPNLADPQLDTSSLGNPCSGKALGMQARMRLFTSTLYLDVLEARACALASATAKAETQHERQTLLAAADSVNSTTVGSLSSETRALVENAVSIIGNGVTTCAALAFALGDYRRVALARGFKASDRGLALGRRPTLCANLCGVPE